jgi:site-specific recombinase XerD
VTDRAFDRPERPPHPHRVDSDAGTPLGHGGPGREPSAPYPQAPITATPARPPRKRPRRRCPAEVLTEAEVRALMAGCDPDTAIGLRHRALLAVLYRAGFRISEALQLRPKDAGPASGTIRVPFGKRGYARTVGMDPGAMANLQQWMGTRERLGYPPSAPVFCTASGKQMTSAFIRRLLPRLGRKAGVFKRVHAHRFRHTHAAQLRVEGVDIGIISKQLGHISITTTARYLDHMAPFAVVESFELPHRCDDSTLIERLPTAHTLFR